MTLNENDRLNTIKGVGDKTEETLRKLGITTVGELLLYYPRAYDCYEEPVTISEVRPGQRCAIRASVVKKPDLIGLKRVKMLTGYAHDLTGKIRLNWFNAVFMRNAVQPGREYIFRGMVREAKNGLSMDQPEIIDPAEYEAVMGRYMPIYPLTTGITNKTLIKLIKQLVSERSLLKDYVPLDIRRKYSLAEYNFAVEAIHFPRNKEELMTARGRLAFDELFVFALALKLLRDSNDREKNTFEIHDAEGPEKLIASLPYSLTDDQLAVWEDIKRDLKSERVMNRLIQGDVGSGKTVIALLALMM
ncbi:MAG: ATP-dependent DNA helicase RecG, partial [Lachnospiraceae bacterium]|nr:ATP-dependent DNA helicase RecG [Lachnospiraceae bacterium]